MLPLLFIPASRQKPHQVQQILYPSAITGGPVTACRCPLNGTFNPVQQCLSEAIFHLCLHIPLSLGTPYIKKFSGDFPVVWCTHVLSSSTSFPYEKIVTHFRWFVNGELLIYGYLTLHGFLSGFHGDHCGSFCFCSDLSAGGYRCYGFFAGCIGYLLLACCRSKNCF